MPLQWEQVLRNGVRELPTVEFDDREWCMRQATCGDCRFADDSID
jgi:hypothetical protein